MKKIYIAVLFLVTSIMPSWAAKVPELTTEEAIALLEAFSFSHTENQANKEAGVKKLPYPSVEVMLKYTNTAYGEVLSWVSWHELLVAIKETVKPNKGSFEEAFITYDTIRRFNVWQNPAYIYLTIFNAENLELYSMPLSSGKVMSNRFDHFKAYLEELADVDIVARGEKAQTDFGYDLSRFIFWASSNFDRFYETQKDYTDYPGWKERVEMAKLWSEHSSMMADAPHQEILTKAFGKEVINGWKESHPALLDGNTIDGILAISLATSLSQKSEKDKLNAFNSLFIFFAEKSGNTLFKEKELAIKNLRAFYKKYQADVAKIEKNR